MGGGGKGGDGTGYRVNFLIRENVALTMKISLKFGLGMW